MTNQNQEPKGKWSIQWIAGCDEKRGNFREAKLYHEQLGFIATFEHPNLAVAQQIIEALNEKAEWISVEDRLPEVEGNDYASRRVLCLVGLNYEIGFVGRQGEWYSATRTGCSLIPSHWRELPQPADKWKG